MTLEVWYWILMLLWLLFGFWTYYVPGQPYPVWRGGRHMLLFFVLLILGLRTFGSPVK